MYNAKRFPLLLTELDLTQAMVLQELPYEEGNLFPVFR